MPDVDVIPNGNWDGAQSATVQVIGAAAPINNVPILIMENTPAMITIKQKDYRNGVIVLNENARPANNNPINTHQDRNVIVIEEQKSQKLIPIPITENAGWPCGKIIMWK